MLGSDLQSSRGDVPVPTPGNGQVSAGQAAADGAAVTGHVDATDAGADVDVGDEIGEIGRCWAEEVHVFERLITAPTAGTFHPTYSDITVDNPVMIAVGDEIGVLVQSGEKHTVESPFTGLLMGLIALPGERVRAHQPLAWLTTDDDLMWD